MNASPVVAREADGGPGSGHYRAIAAWSSGPAEGAELDLVLAGLLVEL
ncbi:hypothetical protein ACFZB9_07895 [Kitasatospora sp. NPDC008050]